MQGWTRCPNGFDVQDATFRTDRYDAEKEMAVAFGLLDAEAFTSLRLIGEARVQTASQIATPGTCFRWARSTRSPARKTAG